MLKNLALLIIVLMAMSCNKKTNEHIKTSEKANDLIGETSPYLLQHAYNPVNWKPWGDKALEMAKKENKLLVISIGYASCHWCHVMEEESFEDDSIAELMNEDFINIKVDREERPDIDQIYMDAIQLMTGRGGWPLNVIALPDGRPVYAGTYHTKSQWKQMLIRMSELYEKKPQDLIDYATQLTKGINNYNLVPYNTEPPKFSKALLDEGITNQIAYWDNQLGGSKQAPKFPLPNKLDFLMRYAYQEDDKDVMQYVLTTLDQMAYGGIYDQVGGGFARYSTDKKWHIPHFEKMLYDNAQLVSTYSHAYALTRKDLYKQTVYETLSFVERELMSDAAAFYSSLDADSMNEKGELEEGAFYVWSKDELKNLLGNDFDIFADYFNVNSYGLWEQGNYVLIRKSDIKSFTEENDLNISDFQDKLRSWKNLLLTERNKKERPRLDDKILTSWNGLMLLGYIDAYKVFNEPKLLSIAKKNARFIIDNLIKEDGGLYHNHKDGTSTINGYLEDYASVIKAFLGMYEVTADESWLNQAKNLSEYAVEHFLDNEKSLFYFTSNEDKKLISRRKEIFDNVIPSSNSMMAQNLFELSHYFNHTEFRELSEQMLNNIKPQLSQSPTSFSNWYLLLADFVGPYYEIAISGEKAIEKQKEITSNYIPNSMLAVSEQESDLPLMKNRFTEDDTFIFVCVDGTCKLPVKGTAEALELVERKFENQ